MNQGEDTMSKSIVLAAGLALGWLGGGGGESRAQVVAGPWPSATWDAPAVVAGPSPWAYGGDVVEARFSYSYPAAYPFPAREYVPYGSGDGYPFYGDPYGHPYDRWTWTNLSGAGSQPARYYYPPVR
jgi:hypothetical protein